MAVMISSSCFMNLPLLDSNSTKSLTLQRKRTDHETKQRKNKSSLALSLAATIVIGVIQISDVATVEAVVVKSPVKEMVPRRWSDKRACPPWINNSFETIVPENLPRPSFHRRLELAGLDAPVISEVVTRVNRGSCFSV